MSEITIGIIGLIVLLFLFLTGMELAFLMAVIGFIGVCMLTGFEVAIGMLANDFMDSLASYGLTAIPLFVFMGQIAFNAGIAGKLYDSAHKFLGHIPGGLAVATVAGATVFKAICGSVAATSATFASVAIPEMDRYGYSKKLSTGIVATVGTLGVLLPPSTILIIFGIITNQSIGKLFLAGIFPGLIMAFFFMVVIFGWSRLNPTIGPKSMKYPWTDRIKTIPSVIWPIIVFLLVVIGLMKGIFTPTEAGAVGAFLVLLFCAFRKQFGFGGLKKSVEESLRTTCMVLMLVASSTILGHFVALSNLSQAIAGWVMQLHIHRALIVVVIFFIYLIGGSFMDDLAFMILATPIFFPIITGLGYDPLWAGIMIGLTVCVGSVIPPVAMCVFIVRNMTKVPFGVIYSGVYPFLVSMMVVVVLLFIFPQLATYLPGILMK